MIYRFLLLVMLITVGFPRPLKAEVTTDGTILIITSYNPETRSISDNLSAFMDEYKLRGGKRLITIESMNCKNLSEAHLWKERMASILEKYERTAAPSLIILLGQEAWASFISQNSEIAKKTPAMCGMVSANTVVLPEDSVDLVKWSPDSKDIFKDFPDYNIVSGYVYQYNVDKNIELMRRFYPNMKKVAFISDNTYGGLSMQAFVKKEMKKYPELELMLLDGRTSSFLEVSERIRHLSNDVCVLVGTWRIDCTENYVMGNTTYMLRDANPTLPVFTIASVGLGHWALGGYTPVYHKVGKEIAGATYNFLDGETGSETGVVPVPGNYVFDVKRMHQFGLDSINLPKGAELINKTPGFYEQYKYWVIGVVAAFMFLIACFLIAVYYIVRINHLKDNLEKSGEELLVAKEKAEEAVSDVIGVMTSASDAAYSKYNDGMNPYYRVTSSWNEIRISANITSYLSGYNDPRLAKYASEADASIGGGQIGVRNGIYQSATTQANYTKFSRLNIGIDDELLIMSASEAYFLRAEAALMYKWNMGGTPKELYDAGVTVSMEERKATIGDYLKSEKVPAAYSDPSDSGKDIAAVSTITPKYNESASVTENLERILIQKWIANFPNGWETWADIRRTGYPKLFPIVNNLNTDGVTVQRGMRRLPFPQSEYNTNNANVKAAVSMLGGADNSATDLWWAKKN